MVQFVLINTDLLITLKLVVRIHQIFKTKKESIIMDSNFDKEITQPTEFTEEKKGMSIASMVLGIVGLVAWCIPLFGYPVSILAIIFGVIGKKKGARGMAIAGIIMGAISLVITIINSILGAILYTSMLNSGVIFF